MKGQNLLERFHTLVIVGFRFVYGFRTVTPFALGMSDVRTSRFVFLNGVGAFLWATTCGVLGYLFGAVFESLFQNVKRYEHFALLTILLAGAIIGAMFHLKTRKYLFKG
jgi:membrane protein DedA with SNARE-associated domain